MALSANKNKNWRANYLRALNIVTPDLSTSRTQGRHIPSGEGTRRIADQLTTNGRAETTMSRRRSTPVTDEATRRPTSSNSKRGWLGVSTSTSISTRQSSSMSGSSSRSKRGPTSINDRMSTYVFGLRSHRFRTRRLAPRSDCLMVDPVSTPIIAPTGISVASPIAIPSRTEKLLDRDLESSRRRRSCNDFQNSTFSKQPMVQLLSWEEPSVMLENDGWPLESRKQSCSNTRNDMRAGCVIPINSSKSRTLLRPGSIVEVCEDTEDEHVDESMNLEDDDNHGIFKMEFDGDSIGGTNVFKAKQMSNHRRRTDLKQRRPGGLDDFDHDDEDDVVTPLSASFVPPHQMVDHGCFSLGLRDKLKRKPGAY
ncbi:unnamed protein product [Peronospora belbahrii]|uniref:Uncharacterized protein n=1 Tax=Peronospora belbahrii TaxID=622444 RepID=A0AAU9L108_9STRA|nr:unnamed protein product [Peronospora belbahrii]